MAKNSNSSKPVGFRLGIPEVQFYSPLADRDRRDLGPYLRNILEDIKPLIAYIEANGKVSGEAVWEILKRAGLEDSARSALSRLTPQPEVQTAEAKQ